MFRSIYARMLVTYIMITVFILLFQSVLLVQLYKSSYIDTTAEAAIEQAQQISSIITSPQYNDKFSIKTLLEMLSIYDNDSNHLWLVDSNGVVIEVNQDTRIYVDSDNLAKSLIQVFAGDTVVLDNKFASSMSVPMLTVAVPVKVDNEIKYAIYLHKSIDTAKGVNYTFYRHLGVSSIIAIIISALLVLISSSHITMPIKQLNKMCVNISNGNFNNKMITNGADEIGQLALSFNKMSEKLKRQETLRSGFVANVSHELRSPITSIHGFAQGMLDGTIEEKDRDKYTTIMLEETTRLKRLITELLDLSQIESGEFPLHFTKFDINEQVRRAIIRYIDRMDAKNIDANIEFTQDSCMVFADVDRIVQILVNLIDNAIKFTPENGTISIWTLKEEEKVLVGISDTGCGVSQENLDNIFERFYKSDESHTNKIGTGLGLAIVKKILDQHGETILVSSTPNKGTKFVFTLTSSETE